MEYIVAFEKRNQSLTDVFKKYGFGLLKFIKAGISDIEDAEDAAQDVWLNLTRQTEFFDIESVGSWLYTTARNRITDYYRKKKSIPLSNINGATDFDLDNDEYSENLFFEAYISSELPDQITESKDFWNHLEKALKTLPIEQRRVFVANEIEGKTFQEISDETGIPISTLLARKRYAVAKLRKYFLELDII